MYSLSVFTLDSEPLSEYIAGMTPKELKELRVTLQARQQDMAKLLGVAMRTYQNWEQPEISKAHRQIPDDMAERVLCLTELKSAYDGNHLPRDITWLQIPMTKDQLEGFKRAAWQENKSLSFFILNGLFEKLNAPRESPSSSVFK